MPGLPWTKFQDFYLRLGFLKVLVAVLSPERRSATSDVIVRRLQSPLFDPTDLHPELHSRVKDLFINIYPRRTSSGKEIECPEVAEAILAVDGVDSALYGVTRDTAYKILDWGHDVQLVGRANQITERGLLLRSLWKPEATDRFLSGQLSEWHPLRLTLRERLFFLYHLEEIDLLTVQLIRDLGTIPEGKVLENRDAAKLTSKALLRVLVEAEPNLQSRDILAFRTAQDLALTIAAELDEPVPDAWVSVARQLRVARMTKRSRLTEVKSKRRKTTKNADHQTIPRFEQLIDLGFVTKPDIEVGDPRQALAARRRWKYLATKLCRRWSQIRKSLDGNAFNDSQPFRWNGFAKASVATFHAIDIDMLTRPSLGVIGERLWTAYLSVRRSAGLSPADSIALVAMIDSAADGVCIEMSDFHNLLLTIQEQGDLSDCVYFASGKTLDKMFIQLKPSFPRRFAEVVGRLECGASNG